MNNVVSVTADPIKKGKGSRPTTAEQGNEDELRRLRIAGITVSSSPHLASHHASNASNLTGSPINAQPTSEVLAKYTAPKNRDSSPKDQHQQRQRRREGSADSATRTKRMAAISAWLSPPNNNDAFDVPSPRSASYLRQQGGIGAGSSSTGPLQQKTKNTPMSFAIPASPQQSDLIQRFSSISPQTATTLSLPSSSLTSRHVLNHLSSNTTVNGTPGSDIKSISRRKGNANKRVPIHGGNVQQQRGVRPKPMAHTPRDSTMTSASYLMRYTYMGVTKTVYEDGHIEEQHEGQLNPVVGGYSTKSLHLSTQQHDDEDAATNLEGEDVTKKYEANIVQPPPLSRSPTTSTLPLPSRGISKRVLNNPTTHSSSVYNNENSNSGATAVCTDTSNAYMPATAATSPRTSLPSLSSLTTDAVPPPHVPITVTRRARGSPVVHEVPLTPQLSMSSLSLLGGSVAAAKQDPDTNVTVSSPTRKAPNHSSNTKKVTPLLEMHTRLSAFAGTKKTDSGPLVCSSSSLGTVSPAATAQRQQQQHKAEGDDAVKGTFLTDTGDVSASRALKPLPDESTELEDDGSHSVLSGVNTRGTVVVKVSPLAPNLSSNNNNYNNNSTTVDAEEDEDEGEDELLREEPASVRRPFKRNAPSMFSVKLPSFFMRHIPLVVASQQQRKKRRRGSGGCEHTSEKKKQQRQEDSLKGHKSVSPMKEHCGNHDNKSTVSSSDDDDDDMDDDCIADLSDARHSHYLLDETDGVGNHNNSITLATSSGIGHRDGEGNQSNGDSKNDGHFSATRRERRRRRLHAAEEDDTVPLLLPGGWRVPNLFTRLVAREKTPLKDAFNGLDLTRFMHRSARASRFIVVFLWFIVVKCRRTWVERRVVARFRALSVAYHELFPRSAKGTPPPLPVLEHIRTQLKQCSLMWAKKERARLRLCDHLVAEEAAAVAAMEREEGSIGAGETSSVRRRRLKKRPPLKLPSAPFVANFLAENGFASLLTIEDIVRENALPDPDRVLTFSAALAYFTDARDECNELVAIEEDCFRRLARLFGDIFYELGSQKDVVLQSYNHVVSRLTYFSLHFCFPNDAYAGIFNANFRADMYRLLQYWCSGLIVTHVPVRGWLLPREEDYAEAAMERHRRFAAAEALLHRRRLTGPGTPSHAAAHTPEVSPVHCSYRHRSTGGGGGGGSCSSAAGAGGTRRSSLQPSTASPTQHPLQLKRKSTKGMLQHQQQQRSPTRARMNSRASKRSDSTRHTHLQCGGDEQGGTTAAAHEGFSSDAFSPTSYPHHKEACILRSVSTGPLVFSKTAPQNMNSESDKDNVDGDDTSTQPKTARADGAMPTGRLSVSTATISSISGASLIGIDKADQCDTHTPRTADISVDTPQQQQPLSRCTSSSTSSPHSTVAGSPELSHVFCRQRSTTTAGVAVSTPTPGTPRSTGILAVNDAGAAGATNGTLTVLETPSGVSPGVVGAAATLPTSSAHLPLSVVQVTEVVASATPDGSAERMHGRGSPGRSRSAVRLMVSRSEEAAHTSSAVTLSVQPAEALSPPLLFFTAPSFSRSTPKLRAAKALTMSSQLDEAALRETASIMGSPRQGRSTSMSPSSGAIGSAQQLEQQRKSQLYHSGTSSATQLSVHSKRFASTTGRGSVAGQPSPRGGFGVASDRSPLRSAGRLFSMLEATAAVPAGGRAADSGVIMEEAFDSIDTTIVNGEFLLIAEFGRYTRHVDYLLTELEKRTTRQHRKQKRRNQIAQRVAEQQQQQQQQMYLAQEQAAAAAQREEENTMSREAEDGGADACPGGVVHTAAGPMQPSTTESSACGGGGGGVRLLRTRDAAAVEAPPDKSSRSLRGVPNSQRRTIVNPRSSSNSNGSHSGFTSPHNPNASSNWRAMMAPSTRSSCGGGASAFAGVPYANQDDEHQDEPHGTPPGALQSQQQPHHQQLAQAPNSSPVFPSVVSIRSFSPISHQRRPQNPSHGHGHNHHHHHHHYRSDDDDGLDRSNASAFSSTSTLLWTEGAEASGEMSLVSPNGGGGGAYGTHRPSAGSPESDWNARSGTQGHMGAKLSGCGAPARINKRKSAHSRALSRDQRQRQKQPPPACDKQNGAGTGKNSVSSGESDSNTNLSYGSAPFRPRLNTALPSDYHDVALSSVSPRKSTAAAVTPRQRHLHRQNSKQNGTGGVAEDAGDVCRSSDSLMSTSLYSQYAAGSFYAGLAITTLGGGTSSVVSSDALGGGAGGTTGSNARRQMNGDNMFERLKKMELKRSRFRTTSKVMTGKDLVSLAQDAKRKRMRYAVEARASPTKSAAGGSASPKTGTRRRSSVSSANSRDSNSSHSGAREKTFKSDRKRPSAYEKRDGIAEASGTEFIKLDGAVMMGIAEHASLLTAFPLATAEPADRAFVLRNAELQVSAVPVPQTHPHAMMATALAVEQQRQHQAQMEKFERQLHSPRQHQRQARLSASASATLNGNLTAQSGAKGGGGGGVLSITASQALNAPLPSGSLNATRAMGASSTTTPLISKSARAAPWLSALRPKSVGDEFSNTIAGSTMLNSRALNAMMMGGAGMGAGAEGGHASGADPGGGISSASGVEGLFSRGGGQQLRTLLPTTSPFMEFYAGDVLNVCLTSEGSHPLTTSLVQTEISTLYQQNLIEQRQKQQQQQSAGTDVFSPTSTSAVVPSLLQATAQTRQQQQQAPHQLEYLALSATTTAVGATAAMDVSDDHAAAKCDRSISISWTALADLQAAFATNILTADKDKSHAGNESASQKPNQQKQQSSFLPTLPISHAHQEHKKRIAIIESSTPLSAAGGCTSHRSAEHHPHPRLLHQHKLSNDRGRLPAVASVSAASPTNEKKPFLAPSPPSIGMPSHVTAAAVTAGGQATTRSTPRGCGRVATKGTHLLVIPPEDTLSRPRMYTEVSKEAIRRQEQLLGELETIVERDSVSRRQYINDGLQSISAIRHTQSLQVQLKFQKSARAALELRCAQHLRQAQMEREEKQLHELQDSQKQRHTHRYQQHHRSLSDSHTSASITLSSGACTAFHPTDTAVAMATTSMLGDPLAAPWCVRPPSSESGMPSDTPSATPLHVAHVEDHYRL